MPRYLSPRAPRRIARGLTRAPGAAAALGLILADLYVLLALGGAA